MGELLREVRNAFRALIRTPTVTATAVATLALAIGANTAIFSIVNSALIRPLPFRDSERTVMLWQTLPERAWYHVPASPSVYLYWKENTKGIFDHVSDIDGRDFNYTAGEFPERLWAAKVPADFFEAVGVSPALGRVFAKYEASPGRDNVIVLSSATWQRSFHADKDIVGKKVVLSDASWTVIGVLPENFAIGEDALGKADMWIPAQIQPDPANHFLKVVAHLAPGVTLEQARTGLEAVSARMANDSHPNQDFGSRIVPLRDEMVGKAKTSLWILLGAVGLVLMMACSNIANLLVARGASREKETAIRLALGAGRTRIIRALLVESTLLAFAGGGAGLLISLWGVDALRKLAPANLSLAEYASVDFRVLLFTLSATIFTSFVFGLVPALTASKVDLTRSLNDSGRAIVGRGLKRLRSTLVIVQLSIALVLLTGSGLLLNSFVKLNRVSPGFDPNNLLIAQTTLSNSDYKDKDWAAAFLNRALEKIRALPGVKSASISYPVPMTGDAWITSVTPEGSLSTDHDGTWNANGSTAGVDYFRTIGIPVLRGRTFSESEMGSNRLMVIGETLAHRFFGSQDPIGKRIGFGRSTAPLEIIGVVGDVKQASLTEEPKSEFYIPFSPEGGSTVYIAVRSDSEITGLASSLKEAIASVDKDQPIYKVTTMSQIISRSLSEQRFVTVLIGLFGAQAIMLSSVGIYGVASYFVSQRTQEIGVRMALGARASDVTRLVMTQAGLQVATGLVIGIAASIALSRLLGDLLYNVDRTDPYTYAAVALVLAGAALAASFIPARRAAKVDPMIALRTE